MIHWELYLSAFTYRTEHVPGDLNTWPDVMTPWMHGYSRTPAIERVVLSLFFSEVTTSPDSPEFNRPSHLEILEVQEKYKNPSPSDATADDSKLLSIKGAVWIPGECIDLI